MANHEAFCTAEEALARLKEGNKKFLAGEQAGALTQELRGDLVANGQHPYACVVACSDSRVLPETIFCAGAGELFVVRTAGNTITASEMASVAYAGNHLQVPLVVVMGHTHCGAVGAALSDHKDEDVEHIVGGIRKVIGQEKEPRKCEMLNAQAWAKKIADSAIFAPYIKEGKKKVVAALYDTESGEVEFY